MTWQEKAVHVWDVEESVIEGDDGEDQEAFQLYPFTIIDMPEDNHLEEGRGLAHLDSVDQTALLTTNGTHTIAFLDPSDLSLLKTINARYINNTYVHNLNELELIDDHLNSSIREPLSKYVFATEFGTDHIHMIRLDTGLIVRTWILDALRGF